MRSDAEFIGSLVVVAAVVFATFLAAYPFPVTPIGEFCSKFGILINMMILATGVGILVGAVIERDQKAVYRREGK